MNTIDKGLKWIGAGALIFLGAKALGDAAMNKIEVVPGKARANTSMLPQYLGIEWSLFITNNNPVGIRIDNIVGEVFYRDIKVANVSTGAPVALTPGERREVVVQLTINSVQLITDIVNNIAQYGVLGVLASSIRFKGTVYTNVLNVPLDTAIQLF